MAKIRGWKDTSKTFSDGSKSIEWTSKTSKVQIRYHNRWIVSIRSIVPGKLTPYIVSTNNSKQQAYKKAYSYMRTHPDG